MTPNGPSVRAAAPRFAATAIPAQARSGEAAHCKERIVLFLCCVATVVCQWPHLHCDMNSTMTALRTCTLTCTHKRTIFYANTCTRFVKHVPHPHFVLHFWTSIRVVWLAISKYHGSSWHSQSQHSKLRCPRCSSRHARNNWFVRPVADGRASRRVRTIWPPSAQVRFRCWLQCGWDKSVWCVRNRRPAKKQPASLVLFSLVLTFLLASSSLSLLPPTAPSAASHESFPFWLPCQRGPSLVPHPWTLRPSSPRASLPPPSSLLP